MTNLRKRVSLFLMVMLLMISMVACSGGGAGTNVTDSQTGGETGGLTETSADTTGTESKEESEPIATTTPDTEPPALIDTTPVFFIDLNQSREYEVMQAITGEGGNNSKLLQSDSIRLYAEKELPDSKYSWRIGFHTDTFTATADQVILVRVKNNCDSSKLVYVADAGKAANNLFAFQGRCDITPYMDQYVDYIYNIADGTLEGVWAGEINRFRLQFAALTEVDLENDFVDIEYVGIFENEQAAEQFDIEAWRAANPPSGQKIEVTSKGRPTLLWNFGKDAEAEIRSSLLSTVGTVDFTEDAVKVTADSTGWRLMLACELEAAQGAYMKIRLKNESASTRFKLWTSPIEAGNLIFLTQPKISANDSEYQEYILRVDDADAFGQGDWNGTVLRMRFDLGIEPTPKEGDTMYIDYVAFFSTLEDAQGYQP